MASEPVTHHLVVRDERTNRDLWPELVNLEERIRALEGYAFAAEWLALAERVSRVEAVVKVLTQAIGGERIPAGI